MYFILGKVTIYKASNKLSSVSYVFKNCSLEARVVYDPAVVIVILPCDL